MEPVVVEKAASKVSTFLKSKGKVILAVTGAVVGLAVVAVVKAKNVDWENDPQYDEVDDTPEGEE